MSEYDYIAARAEMAEKVLGEQEDNLDPDEALSYFKPRGVIEHHLPKALCDEMDGEGYWEKCGTAVRQQWTETAISILQRISKEVSK